MKNKIGILLENRFIDREIIYYSNRFKEENLETVFLTRLWGQPQLTFKGLELGMEKTVSNSFEELTDEQLNEYAAIIVPAGYVADYLLYSEIPQDISPAALFIEKLMGRKDIIKGFICHSLWLAAPIKQAFASRDVTCHNNIIAHIENAGMKYIDSDIHVDEDLITARTGDHFSEFSTAIIKKVFEKKRT